MNENAVRSKDHVDLTFIFARLQEDGYLTADDIKTLREMAERLDEPRLEWLAEDVRYIGGGMYVPNDKERFTTELDSIRYQIHRIVESKLGYGSDVSNLTEKELLTALPELVIEEYSVRASEDYRDDLVEREILARRGENEIELRVVDDLGAQRRRVELDMVGHIRVEADTIVHEKEYEVLEKYKLEDPVFYIASKGYCSPIRMKTIYGEETEVYRCEVDLDELIESDLSRENKLKMINEITDMFKDYECLVTRSEDRIVASCEVDIVERANWSVEDYIRDLVEYELEDVYLHEVLPSFEEEWNRIGKETPIPLECDTTYAYPHIHSSTSSAVSGSYVAIDEAISLAQERYLSGSHSRVSSWYTS